MTMDTFLVKDVAIELPVTTLPFTFYIPVVANFGRIQQEVEGTPVFRYKQEKHKYHAASLPAVMQTFYLRISRSVVGGNSNVEVTAFGPPLAQFMNRYRRKTLRMIYEGTFGHGFVLLIAMVPKYDRELDNGRSRYFQGSVPICPATHLGKGQFSLEIIEQEVRDFSRYALPIPPAAKVLASAQHTDFLLRSADGSEFPCLKSFLSVGSPVFQRMLSTDTQENRDGVANVPGSQAAVNSLLKYVYYEDMVDPCRCVNVAMELLKLSILYEMESFANSLKHVLMNKPVGAINLDTALKLFTCTYQHAGMIELKDKALEIIRSMRNQFGASLILWNILQGTPELEALRQQL